MEQKKYGLIRLSKTDKPKTTLKKNIFESDSDDDIQSDSKRVNTSSGIKRQTELDITRALTDDPNVFEYDSIYEAMKSQKESDVNDSQTKTKQKPKYINNLLKFSEDRKKQNERRVERKIQKERENEGNQFEDKEQFVTNAYKEKIKEMEAADQLEKRQEAIEELLDVKKQKDLSGFYRHLLNGDMSSNKDSLPSTLETLKDISQEISKEIPKSIPKPKTNRQIRRRRSSSEESSEELPQRSEIKEIKTEIIDKSKQREKFDKKENKKSSRRLSDSEDNRSEEENTSIKKDSKNNQTVIKQETDVQNNNSSKEEEKEVVNKIPKLDKRQLLIKIFTKRTVGEAFTEAQMRYFQRKNNYVI